MQPSDYLICTCPFHYEFYLLSASCTSSPFPFGTIRNFLGLFAFVTNIFLLNSFISHIFCIVPFLSNACSLTWNFKCTQLQWARQGCGQTDPLKPGKLSRWMKHRQVLKIPWTTIVQIFLSNFGMKSPSISKDSFKINFNLLFFHHFQKILSIPLWWPDQCFPFAGPQSTNNFRRTLLNDAFWFHVKRSHQMNVLDRSLILFSRRFFL